MKAKAVTGTKQAEHRGCRTCGGTGFVMVERGETKHPLPDGSVHIEPIRWAARCPELEPRAAEDVPF